MRGLVKVVVSVYIIVYVTILCHETAHYVALKKLKINVVQIVIGCGKLSIKIKNVVTLSLIPINGYTEFDTERIAEVSNIGKFAIAFSGVIFNVLLSLFAYISYKFIIDWRLLFGALLNAVLAIINVVPYIGKNDYNTFKLLLSWSDCKGDNELMK